VRQDGVTYNTDLLVHVMRRALSRCGAPAVLHPAVVVEPLCATPEHTRALAAMMLDAVGAPAVYVVFASLCFPLLYSTCLCFLEQSPRVSDLHASASSQAV
jgi:hypothetical protein